MKAPAPEVRRLNPKHPVPVPTTTSAPPVGLVFSDIESFWEQAPIGLGVVDANLRFVRVNQSLARLLRRSREQLVGSVLASAGSAFARDAADACRAVLRDGMPVARIPTRCAAPAHRGRETRLALSAHPLDGTASEGRRVALIVEDDSRQQELQDSLDGRLRFEQLIADLLAHFVDLADDAVEQAVAGALERLGRFLDVDRITLAEADAQTFRVLQSWAAPGIKPVPQTFKVSDMPWYAQQLHQGATVRVVQAEDLPPQAWHEREMMRRQGTKSHLAIPLSIDQGVVGALALGALRRRRDWPDELVQRLRLVGQIFATALGRKNANERLARQHQELAHVGRVAAMGELAAILAHDLNQPLTAILTNAQATRRLIEHGGAGAGETDEALSDIADDANRAGAIIRRLRALLRKGEPSLVAVDVNRLLTEVEPIVAAELREYEVAMKLELSDGLPPVRADAIQLQQVLLNLVSNACHAMSNVARDQRELVIRTTRGDRKSDRAGDRTGGAADAKGDGGAPEPDMVGIAVRDSGEPISTDVFARIFEPFFTTKPNGLGMGLAITRSIIAAHRGRVWATQNSRRGITVHVALPMCP